MEEKKIPKYITDNIEISSYDSDNEVSDNSDEERSHKEINFE